MKKTVVYQHSGILFGHKKERTTDINSKMDASQKHYDEWIQTQELLIYSIQMTFKNREE